MELIMTIFKILAAVVGLLLAATVVLVVGCIIWVFYRQAKDNASPVLEEMSTVVTKHTRQTYTSYKRKKNSFFIAFQLEGGKKIGMAVPGPHFAQLMEGDVGRVRHQGSRYMGFLRDEQDSIEENDGEHI